MNPADPQDSSKSGDSRSQSGLVALRARISAQLREAARHVDLRVRVALVVGVLMVVVTATFFSLTVHPKLLNDGPVASSAQKALEAYDRGAHQHAKRLAEELVSEQSGGEEEGAGHFILGAIAAADAERMWGDDRLRFYVSAAKYLEEAQRDGFPQGREGEGYYLLGKSLCLSRQYTAAKSVLTKAFKTGGHATEIHALLARAYMDDSTPELNQALEQVRSCLADPQLTPAMRYTNLLLEGQVLFRVGQNAECEAVLKKIPRDSALAAEANILRGRLAMRAALQFKDQQKQPYTTSTKQAINSRFKEAIKVLFEAQSLGTSTSALRQAQTRGLATEEITCESNYLIATCYLAMDDVPAALEKFQQTRINYPDTPEGMAAAFQEADLLMRLGRNDESIATFQRAVATSSEKANYVNPLMPAEAVQDCLNKAYTRFLKDEKFAEAVRLAGVMYPFVKRDKSLQLAAEAHQATARHLIARASTSSVSVARTLVQKAREQLCDAGKLYDRVAEMRFTSRDYSEDLWNSAVCYFEGHDYRSSNRVLSEYLKFELRKRRPRVLLYLGESYLAIGKPREAIDALAECIHDFATDVATYRARIVAAAAYTELGDDAKAEKMLLDNLEGGDLAPQSVEWRDSLFDLAELLARVNRNDAAMRRFEEAIQRYPEASQAIEARYLLAETYCRAAEVPRKKLESDTIETARNAHTKQVHELLTAAIAQFERVQMMLARREEHTELEPYERAILRNCYFNRGAALYDLGNYAEAIKAYAAATTRYQNSPESLEGFLQIAACYRRMNRPEEARGTLQQARVILTRLPATANFKDTTNYSREKWSEVLDRLIQI